jgi:hypothetical protein
LLLVVVVAEQTLMLHIMAVAVEQGELHMVQPILL